MRVLFALPSYPALSNPYMHIEVVAAQRLGVHVEVWSGRTPTRAVPNPTARVHTGSVADAIGAFRPHVVHVHWLVRNFPIRRVASRAGIPVTVRGHSFDFDVERVAKLARDTAVQRIWLFPHMAEAVADSSGKVRPLRVMFDPRRYRPARHKDPRVVARACVSRVRFGGPRYLEIARRLPEHHFVLITADALGGAGQPEALAALDRERGGRVEHLRNLPFDEAARVVSRAGIYLHLRVEDKPFGMPLSIAESMATGSYALAPRLPGAEAYVGDAGAIYGSEGEAVELIEKTLSWSPGRWRDVREAAADWAGRFSSERRMPEVIQDWESLRR